MTYHIGSFVRQAGHRGRIPDTTLSQLVQVIQEMILAAKRHKSHKMKSKFLLPWIFEVGP